jgi:hypothetical protein
MLWPFFAVSTALWFISIDAILPMSMLPLEGTQMGVPIWEEH